MKIKTLTPRMILDSRGYPTVEVDCVLEEGGFGRASVPSGASTGSHEALELRDGDKAIYDGKGVTTALKNITTKIAPGVLGKEFSDERALDAFLITLDGTDNKSNLGANATLPVSLAFAKARASNKNIPLYQHLRETYSFSKEALIPVPLINVLNGGKHATNSTDIQEWMIVPKATSYGDALKKAARVFYALRALMEERGTSGVGDEGGFPLEHASSNEEALTFLCLAVERAGLSLREDIVFALDVASSEFFKNGTYELRRDGKSLNEDEMIEFLETLTLKYPIVSIEDGLSENSWEGWKKATEKLGDRIQLVGDDLFVTNTSFIQKGIDEGAGNAVLIKPNQIGTLSETVDAIELAHKNGRRAIVSHRSGETEDATIAHLAVASGCGQIKTGSLSRSERLIKYNELLRIAEDGVAYGGGDLFFKGF